jgi:hypothetical protein
MESKQWVGQGWTPKLERLVKCMVEYASQLKQDPRFYNLKDPVHNNVSPFTTELFKQKVPDFTSGLGKFDKPLVFLGLGTYPKPFHLTGYGDRSQYICLEIRNKQGTGDRVESEDIMQVAVPFCEGTQQAVEGMQHRYLGDVVQENLHNLMYCDMARIRPERFSETYMDIDGEEYRMSPTQAVLLAHIRPSLEYQLSKAEAFLLDSAPFDPSMQERILTRSFKNDRYSVALTDHAKKALFGLWSREIDQG